MSMALLLVGARQAYKAAARAYRSERAALEIDPKVKIFALNRHRTEFRFTDGSTALRLGKGRYQNITVQARHKP